MSEPAKAVFLSYASQDAEAAKRICDALRGAGIEVWFDQNELVGGDAWDAKIRKQIGSCALFIPIISAGTQARAEGYFRLEWRLADKRTELMGKAKAFLLPVCIDNTRDHEADVPDSFTAVQWTRLKGGETTPAFVTRVQKLLGGSEMEVGRPRPAVLRGEGTPPPRRAWRFVLIPVAMLLLAGAGVMIKRYKDGAPATPAAQAAVKTAAAAARDWPKDPELKRAIGLLDRNDAIPEDFRLAEEITQRVLDKSPTDAESLTAMARVQSMWLMRGWDRSTNRYQKAKSVTERALQLAPEEPEAHAAVAAYLFMRGSDSQRALDLAQRAVDLAPGEPRFHRLRDSCLWVVSSSLSEGDTDTGVERTSPALERALASSRRTAERFPQDALARYDLARHYRDLGRWKEFEEEMDAALALAPVANVIVWKARARFGLHGDLAGMKALLDQVPARVRGVERTVFSYFLYSAFTGNTREGLDALNGMPETWMIDFDYRGPKALPTAILLELGGKKELARLQYEAALAELQRSRDANPSDVQTYLVEAWILHGLGRGDGARTALRIYIESVPRPYVLTPISTWWFQPIAASLLMGERATALALMREAAAGSGEGRDALRSRLALDRRMAPFRDDPEIKALLADAKPGPETAAPKADEKSVAVLAFANLSDDKANEYFSDGISEELLNVLAKVPKLKVAARTSSFYFKGQNVPIPEIAQKLGVAYVVEGSVRKAGNKVRITAQLIKAADGFHVWSETYDRDLSDIFAVQDEIAKNILGAVKGSLMGEAELPHTTTTKIEAYTLFLQGQGAFARRGVAGLEEAIRLFEAALAIDPDYVPALAGLAQARVLVPIYANLSGAKAAGMVAAGRKAAQRVLALDPRNATAHVVLGWAMVQVDWRWSEGLEQMLRARELAPNDAWIWNSLGDYYRFVGDLRQSLAAKRREWELDPLSFVSHWDLAYTYQVAGDYDQTIHWAELAIRLAPHNLDSYIPAILIAAQTGRLEKMRTLLAAARREVHENEGMLLLLEARGAIAENKRAEALRILTKVVPLAESGDSTPAYLGYLYLLLGESKQAAHWLQQGYERHDGAIVWPENIDFDVIAANPATRPILDRPGLKELYELRQRNARAGLNKL